MKSAYIFSITASLLLCSIPTHAMMDPYEIVEHLFPKSPRVNYSPGPFMHFQEGLTTFSTVPQPPLEACTNQSVLICDKVPLEFNPKFTQGFEQERGL